MKNALHVLRYAKTPSDEKIKHAVLDVICLKTLVSQSVGRSVSQSVGQSVSQLLKIKQYFINANQCCLIVWENRGWILNDIILWGPPLLRTTTVVHDYVLLM